MTHPPFPPTSEPQPSSPGPAPSARPGSPDSRNFFTALFDLSFTRFITVKFAGFIYVAAIVVLIAVWLVGLVRSFMDGPSSGVGFLLIGTLFCGVYLIFIRVMLEFVVATVRTARNTAELQTELQSMRWDLAQKQPPHASDAGHGNQR